MSRLDRLEPQLNENAPGDPRDTTTPVQMARSASRLIFGDGLAAREQAILRGWLVASSTGRGRIRAGLPEGWSAGDKTGTCGGANPSYNDVAFILPVGEEQRGSVLAVYLDRPTAEDAAADRAHAEVARAAEPLLRR